MAELDDLVEKYVQKSVSESTKRSYSRSFGQFTDYCADLGTNPYEVTADFVAKYLVQRYQSCGLSRLYVHLSAISHYYRAKGLESPCDNSRIRMMMKGKKCVKNNAALYMQTKNKKCSRNQKGRESNSLCQKG